MSDNDPVFNNGGHVGIAGTIRLGESLNTLAASMLKGISKEGCNAVISPSCLYQAICLLADLTAGSTHDEVMDAIGGVDEARNLFWAISHIRDHYEGWGCDDFRYSTGASVWLARSVTPNPDFASSITRMIPVEIEQVDMGTDDAKGKMREWLSDKTGGIYDEGPETSANTLLVALSTMYLKDAWDDSFDEGEPHQFNPSGKPARKIAFMRDWEKHAVLLREGSATVSKMLTSGIRLVISIPPASSSLDYYVQSGDAWRNIQDYAASSCDKSQDAYNIHLPKFSLSSDNVDVTNLVRETGIAEAFMPEADFSPITLDGLMVEKFIQNTRLEIDEGGLEGASYVAMCAFAGCAALDNPEPKDLYIDRSFAVAVVSPKNIPLFVGTVIDPSEVN